MTTATAPDYRAEIADIRRRAMAATSRADLDSIYIEMMGLGCLDGDEDPADDTTTSIEDARAIILDALDEAEED